MAFTTFSKLPIELRLKIWAMALPERVIEVMWTAQNNRFYHQTPVPTLFHVCQESRLLAMSHYDIMEIENLPESPEGDSSYTVKQQCTLPKTFLAANGFDRFAFMPFTTYINYCTDVLYLSTLHLGSGSLGEFSNKADEFLYNIIDENYNGKVKNLALDGYVDETVFGERLVDMEALKKLYLAFGDECCDGEPHKSITGFEELYTLEITEGEDSEEDEKEVEAEEAEEESEEAEKIRACLEVMAEALQSEMWFERGVERVAGFKFVALEVFR
jgi:hypothetical protein